MRLATDDHREEGLAAATAVNTMPRRSWRVPPTQGSLRLEQVLVLPRALVGVGVAVMAWLVPDTSPVGLLVCAAYFVAVSAWAHRALADAPDDRRPFLWTSVADAIGCLAVFALLAPSPEAPAVILFPLLAFELGLKYCVRGTAAALVLLAGSMAIRSAYRADEFGMTPRVWLIFVMIAVTGALLGLAGVLRSQDRAWRQAEEDRRRLADLLRGTVQATLDEVEISTSPQQRADLLALVEQACARPELGSEITRRLAKALVPASDTGPLSARETEILELVASGRSDRDIAGRLFLSRGTVRVHVSNIVRKLEVSDRAAAVAWYHERHPEVAPSDG